MNKKTLTAVVLSAVLLSACGSTQTETSIETTAEEITETTAASEVTTEAKTETETEKVTEAETEAETEESVPKREKAQTDASGNYISPSGWILDPNVKAADIERSECPKSNVVYHLATTSEGVNFYGIIADESMAYPTEGYYAWGDTKNPKIYDSTDYVIIEYDGFVDELQSGWTGRWLEPAKEILEGDYDNDGSTEYSTIIYTCGGTENAIFDLTVYKLTDDGYKAFRIDSYELIDSLKFSVEPTEKEGFYRLSLDGTDVYSDSEYISDVAEPVIDAVFGYEANGDKLKFVANVNTSVSLSPGSDRRHPTVPFECDVHFDGESFTWDNFWMNHGKISDRIEYEYTELSEGESELIIDLNCDGKTEKIHNINPFGLCELTYTDSEDKEQTIEFDVTSVWGGTWYLSDIKKIVNIPQYGHTEGTGCGYDIYIYDFSGADIVKEHEIHTEGGYVVDGVEETMKYFIDGEEYSYTDFKWNISLYSDFRNEMGYELFCVSSENDQNYKLNIEKNTNFVMGQ